MLVAIGTLILIWLYKVEVLHTKAIDIKKFSCSACKILKSGTVVYILF